jgi:2-polyprenyl-3-methyl-5-hydroxy-6-metoxy-1,4-benzoquinol methylase
VRASRASRVELRSDDAARLATLQRDPADYIREIEEGTLQCATCEAEFPIRRGVPRFATSPEPEVESVMRTYGEQWAEFRHRDGLIWHWSLEDRIKSFLFEIDASPHELEGTLVIDAGCGSGIVASQVATRYGAEVVGFDLSNAVEAAQAHNISPLCHFVQASVFDPPLKRDAFDIVYSHGVLMMTPDTRRAFRSIAPLAKPGGKVYLWVYGKKRGWQRVKFLIVDAIRIVVNRLPTTLQNATHTDIGGNTPKRRCAGGSRSSACAT